MTIIGVLKYAEAFIPTAAKEAQAELDELRACLAEYEQQVTGYRNDQVITAEAFKANAAEITALKQALELIFEVHPTRNTKENYAAAVCEIADNALKAGQQ